MSDEEPKPPPLKRAINEMLPEWAERLKRLPERDGRAWDERARRMKLGIATAEDQRVHQAALEALTRDEPLPPEARKMPGPPLKRVESAWRPSELDTVERAVNVGIPPLIAERIVAGEVKATKSTLACARVGRDYSMLVLIGERGCGKSFAAAGWLWMVDHKVPDVWARKAAPRRFLEAPGLVDVPFEDRRTKLGEAKALAIDDAGTEKDFLVTDIAALMIMRYRNALPTVITTNLSEGDFSERYGMRFADRMREVGRFITVSNSAADSLRGKEV